jgi:hydrogenase small subunit
VNFNITRRQFLQYCTASAAALGLSQTDLLKLEKAMATPQTGCSSPTPSVIWMTGLACSGCQTSLLNRVVDCAGTGYYDADLINPLYGVGGLAPFGAPYYTVAQGTPSDPVGLELNVVNDVADLLVGDAVGTVAPQITPRALSWAPFNAGYITLEWLTTVNAGAGDINVQHIQPIVNAGGFVLLLDGAIPTVDERFCLVFDNQPVTGGPKIEPSLPTGSITLSDALRWMLPKAAFAISVGACSSYGGIPAGKRNKTGAMGLKDWAADEHISTTVVNVPGCPPHPDWIVYPVAYFLVHASLPALDMHGRPAATFGNEAFCNDQKCPNKPTQGTPDAAQFLGDDGCQVLMGCKGPVTRGDCPIRQKNVFDDGTVNNWCAAGSLGPNIGESRHVCQGCIQPGFPDFAEYAQTCSASIRTERGIKGFYNRLAGNEN